jgi:hypothetical protein
MHDDGKRCNSSPGRGEMRQRPSRRGGPGYRRGVRRATVPGLCVLAAVVALASGCTETVPPGPGVAAPDLVPSVPAPPIDPSAAAGPSFGLDADVLADECLLDAAQLQALVGEPVLAPKQGSVQRPDGSSASSCYVQAAEGSPAPIAAINVYLPRGGTPADFVRAGAPGGRRELPGVGRAAALVEVQMGTTLQLAGERYVVTITVLTAPPPDDAWRTAATQALAALPA